MLILNNGVPKSGSTWVQKIIMHLIRPRSPADEWRNDWSNPSIDHDRLADYVADGDWQRGKPVLVKLHLPPGPGLDYLQAPGVRMIVSHRNLPDSVLSWFHHQKRLGKLGNRSMDQWIADTGLDFAKDAARYREGWAGVPGVMLCPYEDMVADAAGQIARIADHLGTPVSPERSVEIAEATQERLKPGEAPRDGAHTRTAGQSRAKQELPAESYALLHRMEAQATRNRVSKGAPAVAAPDLVYCGLPQSGGTLLMRALAQELDSHMVPGAGKDGSLPWPGFRDRMTDPVPAGAVQVHRWDGYAQKQKALQVLMQSNPDRRFVLALRDPLDALLGWHRLYTRIAQSDEPRDHRAWHERARFADMDPADFLEVVAGSVADYDAVLSRMLEVVPASRLILVDDAALRTDPSAIALRLLSAAREPGDKTWDPGQPLRQTTKPAIRKTLPNDLLERLDATRQRLDDQIASANLHLIS